MRTSLRAVISPAFLCRFVVSRQAPPFFGCGYLLLSARLLYYTFRIMTKSGLRAALALIPVSVLCFGADTYQKPPKAIEDILNSPATPTLELSPIRTYAIQGSPVRYPPIAELSEPMLRLAGIRINPKTNGLHNTTFESNLLLRRIPEGTEIKIALPPNPKLSMARWSPDGSHFAFTNSTAQGIEIWIGDTSGHTHRLQNVRLNEVFGGGGRGGGGGGRGGAGAGGALQWLADNRSLLVQAVRPNRGAPPAEAAAPEGPHIQESLGGGKVRPLTKTYCRIRTTKIFSSTMPPRNWRL